MTTNEIINEIVEKGRFVHSPAKWDQETNTSLSELLELKIIMQSTTLQMNQEYIYVAK